MLDLFRRTITHPALALGSTLMWGLVEFMALQGSHRAKHTPDGDENPLDQSSVTRLKR